ncbi:MAG: hypothetical protein EOP50_08500, partial [Sphingobacteriales bacterium]
GVPVAGDGMAYVQVDKDGFFVGSRTIITRPSSQNTVRIQLIAKRIVASFSAGSGGTAPLDAGGSVLLPADGYVDAATGAAYTGTVRVAAFTFDPTSAAFLDNMPGALLATRADNSAAVLQSYSMAAVELLGANGQKLQLKNGKEATLNLPIPSGLIATAPASIPLWYFDEAAGLWREEGSAQRQGSYYVGVVHHFSIWNADAPYPLVMYTTQVLGSTAPAPAANSTSTPVSGMRVKFTTIPTAGSSSMSVSTFTDHEGYISGCVPFNVPLRLELFNTCNEVIYTELIGPITTATTTTTTIWNYQPVIPVNFSGTVTNCSGSAVTQGIVTLLIEAQVYRVAVVNGTYNYSHPTCVNTVTADIVVDDTGVMQASSNYHVTGQRGSTITTNLQACGITIGQEESVTYTFNGSTRTMYPATDSVFIWCYQNPNQTMVYAVPHVQPQTYGLALKMTGTQSPGLQTMTSLELIHNNQEYYAAQPGSVLINNFGGINDYVTGTFFAMMRDSASANTSPLSGSFRLRRRF